MDDGISWCKSWSIIYNWRHDGQYMAGGMLLWSMTDRPLGGQKRKGKTTTCDGSNASMASPPIKMSKIQVGRGCDYTCNSTCYIMASSDRV